MVVAAKVEAGLMEVRNIKVTRHEGGGIQAQNTAPLSFGRRMGRRHATAQSLAPLDSVSCVEPLGLVEKRKSKEEPFMDDEDDEYDDKEFFDSLEQWASDVWTATHCDDGSDSEATMVGVALGPALSKG